jgi:uracil-DNA glycosylase
MNKRLERLYSRYDSDPAFAHLRERSNFVPGRGLEQEPKLFLIGEAPGRNENARRLPFVGRAGEILDWMLGMLGLLPDEVWITNAVKYRPPANRSPLPTEIEASRPYLRKEAQIIQPMIIVPMGAAALRLVVPEAGGISRWHGRPIYHPKRLPVFPLYHPMFVGYSGRAGKLAMKADCQKLREML